MQQTSNVFVQEPADQEPVQQHTLKQGESARALSGDWTMHAITIGLRIGMGGFLQSCLSKQRGTDHDGLGSSISMQQQSSASHLRQYLLPIAPLRLHTIAPARHSLSGPLALQAAAASFSLTSAPTPGTLLYHHPHTALRTYEKETGLLFLGLC